jgi:hypothetical protein
MLLEGVVTNVTNFGALWTSACIRTTWCIFPCFPQIRERPRDVVKAGDVVVKVLKSTRSGGGCVDDAAG